MSFLLQEEFIVKFNRKSRSYIATLTTQGVTFKPIDILKGRIIHIPRTYLISCQSILAGEEENGLFQLIAFDPETFKIKTFNVHSSSHLKEPEAVSLIWIKAFQRCFPLPNLPPNKSILVLVNPKSGQGLAKKLSRKICPLLQSVGFQLNLVETRHQNHGKDIVINADLTKFRTILVFSGDGLVHEVVNGIYERDDAEDIFQRVHIVPFPVGSGNGLNRSLVHFSGYRFDGKGIHFALFNVLRGRSTEIDSFLVQQENQEDRVAFLSLTYGIIADIDIESEALRSLGSLRFTIWAVHRITSRKNYQVKISYLKAEGNRDIQWNLPPLDEDLPDFWEVEHDEFTSVNIINMPYIGEREWIAPSCDPNDGLLWMLLIRKEAKKADLMKIFMEVETGKHIKNAAVDMMPIIGFRLEPTDNEGYLSLDGEVLETKGIQGIVRPKSWKTLTR